MSDAATLLRDIKQLYDRLTREEREMVLDSLIECASRLEEAVPCEKG